MTKMLCHLAVKITKPTITCCMLKGLSLVMFDSFVAVSPHLLSRLFYRLNQRRSQAASPSRASGAAFLHNSVGEEDRVILPAAAGRDSDNL